MNYLAHALPFLDRPYLMAGTAVPDWLAVADRSVRLRSRDAAPLAVDPDEPAAQVAQGVLQHFRDDARFHETRAFAESMLALTVRFRDALGADAGFRPGFLGHLLVEVLVDASLAAEDLGRLETYYAALETVDPNRVQQAVNRIARRPTDRLAPMIWAFFRERILWDYLEDAKLLVRLNQVMRRVGLAPLPDAVLGLFPEARQLVDRRRQELLEGIPVPSPEDQVL